MRVRIRAAVAVLAMVAAALAVPTTADAATVAPIDWKPCAAPLPSDVDCASVSVPLDWSRPHGAKTTVALSRRKALDPSARLGSLLFDPGGPGGPGVQVVAFVPDLFSQDVRNTTTSSASIRAASGTATRSSATSTYCPRWYRRCR